MGVGGRRATAGPAPTPGRSPSYPPEARLNRIRYLAAYYFWYFVAVGVFEPYLTPLWRESGFSAAEIGLLNALMPGVASVAPFLWTAYADATRRGGRIFLWNSWLAAAAALLLPGARQVAPAAAAVFLVAAFRAPLIPLANSMAFRVLAGRPQGYAAIRLWGTIGYIVAAVAAGAVMDRAGLQRGMYGVALAMVACGLVAWAGKSRERLPLAPAGFREILDILGDRRLLILVAATALAWMSYGPYATFYTIHLERLGYSRAFAGAAWALAAGSELGVMLLWPRLAGMGTTRHWLIAALAANPLRWMLSGVAQGPGALLAIQLTHAFTFGVFYLATVQRVDSLVPDGLRGTAQGVFASATFGIGGLAGNILGGLLYEPLGMTRLYVLAAAVSTGATVLYAAGSRGEPPEARVRASRSLRGGRP